MPLAKERLGIAVTRFRYRLQRTHCFFQRDEVNILTMKGNAHARLTFVDGARCVHTVASSKHAVISCRRTAALNMPQHGRTYVITGACLDFIADYLADAIKGLVLSLIHI